MILDGGVQLELCVAVVLRVAAAGDVGCGWLGGTARPGYWKNYAKADAGWVSRQIF